MSTASQIIEARHDRFYSEARAAMDRHDLPASAFENVHGAIKHRAYMEEIAPYLKQVSAIMALAMPNYVLVGGELETHGDGLTDAMREIVVQYRAVIADIAFKYYGERSLPPSE